jgi:16S rRNA (adenine1518-N6/adenine1519-N6)-dimethyltransferase
VPPLKKALGQHHLVDAARVQPLVEFLEPADRRVLEIGPGGGVLTGALLGAGARVAACELDLDWAVELRRRLGEPPIALAVADALDLQWGRLPVPTLVCGNLPYNIATALLERLLPHHLQVPRAAFLVQREVAERLVAEPGDAAFGSLSLLVRAYARPGHLGRVRRGSFHPAPRVEGAFVGFELQAPPLPAAEMPPFLALVRAGFSQRRKMLRNSLGAVWGRDRARDALETLHLPAEIRAEELGLPEWLALHAVRPPREGT